MPSTTLRSLQLWLESDLATTCIGPDLTGERGPLRISVAPHLTNIHQVSRVASYSRKESRERGSAVARECSLTTRTRLLSSWPCLVAWITVLCDGQGSPACAPVWPFSSRSFRLLQNHLSMLQTSQPNGSTLPHVATVPLCRKSNSSCRRLHTWNAYKLWAC